MERFERWNEITFIKEFHHRVIYSRRIGKNRKERDRNELVYRYRENKRRNPLAHRGLANIYSRGQSSNQLLKTTVAL